MRAVAPAAIIGPVWACATPGAAQTAAISDQQASAALDPALGNIARLCCQHDRLARSVQPMMANDWRERMSERQMAIIGAPYGLAMCGLVAVPGPGVPGDDGFRPSVAVGLQPVG
ncbi:MAG: hypothetical protein NT037_04220 [Hyphomicrobiales bacterium]|jgi:hypothetical protein|nr:hypothetical protein [Hyphomicrobiales bacterium]